MHYFRLLHTREHKKKFQVVVRLEINLHFFLLKFIRKVAHAGNFFEIFFLSDSFSLLHARASQQLNSSDKCENNVTIYQQRNCHMNGKISSFYLLFVLNFSFLSMALRAMFFAVHFLMKRSSTSAICRLPFIFFFFIFYNS